MKKSFLNMKNGSVISSLRVRTTKEAIADIRDSEKQGADGFLLHAELLDVNFRNIDEIKKIIRSANKPVMILNYRTEEGEEDEKLNRLKFDAITAGAAAADVPMSSYDCFPKASVKDCAESFAEAVPKDVSMDKVAIEKQNALIEKFHTCGCEVLMSAHVETMLSAKQAADLAKEMKRRGADIAKIIVKANNLDDVAEIYKSILYMKKSLDIPFLYQTCGPYGKLVRPTAWIFGSKYILCHNRYSELSNREKPLMKDIMTIKDKLWSENIEK